MIFVGSTHPLKAGKPSTSTGGNAEKSILTERKAPEKVRMECECGRPATPCSHCNTNLIPLMIVYCCSDKHFCSKKCLMEGAENLRATIHARSI